ncbi:hypothetical protein OSB04_024419 [Centaurea solstitialis]|uniref:Reverse transcriptase domain-containing protein n=1 Tax=Centaurea solstitialis TaxID=347529 RepID=A0AA38W337_9ASTR|nr:hypothetical protein OSB04_024419 [Centaurea solstitialis]
MGELVKASKVVKKCTLSLAGKDFSIDLIPIKIGSFDIIVGMDWMSNHRATICCAEKIVMLALLEGGVLKVHGDKPRRDIKIVSYMKMRSHLRKECVAFMAHVVDTVDPALLRPDEMIMILNLYLDQDQETNESVLQSTDPVH